ncbi:MAG TPA: hypothetical protein VK633_12820 [Verrucomicrobiae bacterium]|nr:hypothetical protein [Verrucomicrobiae bacterium]
MNMKWVFLLGICGCALLLNGCVNSLDGRQRVGMPLIKDRIESRYKRSATEIWAAAKDVLKYNGALYSEDLLKSTLEGAVNERTVWVKVEELDPQVTRVIVQTRTKAGLADLELAGELDKQIAVRLATGNLTPGTTAYPR